MDKNVNEIQDLFNSELMTNSIPISNPESLYVNNNPNILIETKKYKEDIITKPKKEIKESKVSSTSKMFDINNKIFSDDDMSLNKSNKFVKQNEVNNNKINNENNNSTNSLMLSLNINEIQLDENNDIKKIIPSEIYNHIRYSGNQLINNTKEGLKKLFIYLSDSLNNQKKISGSNDYYYNNDLNSDNLLKIYIYVLSIINKNENKHDIINESLFIINLILPLLPTIYINNICVQLIDKFYCKTAFDELHKNIYLLFKQILRLNQDTFFDKIFSFLKKEKNIKIKLFWKKFIFELIQKNNENFGIDFYFENNENIINILNEYHKENLVHFCLDLFDYDNLNEIESNKDAIELIKCISENRILNNINNTNNNISFNDMILGRVKENETLYIIINNILNKNEEKDIKIINIDEKKMSNDFGSKNNLNSGNYFQGSFGTFNANKKNFFHQQSENKFNNNLEINNNKKESMEKYNNNEIFEVMDNNIIYESKENNNNNFNNNNIETKPLDKKEENNNKINLNDDNIYLYSDKEEESFEENNININSKKNNEDILLKYKNKKSGGGDSLVNYKFSISNKEIMNINNQKNEKKSIKNNNIEKNEKKSINNNKNASKRTSKISEFNEYFNKRNTLNNNLFSSFSSFSSVKKNSNDIKSNINEDDNDDNEDNITKIIENNNLKEQINNNIENKENEEINNNKEIKIKNNIIDFDYNNINENNDNIINNDKFLELINNNEQTNKIKNNDFKNDENNKMNKYNKKNKENNNRFLSFGKNINFDYENCLNIIDKEKWIEKQEQIKLLKNELNINLTKDNYNKSIIPMDSIINLINKKLCDKQQKLVILMLEIVEVILDKLNEIFNEEYLPLLSKSIINNLNDNNIQLRYKAANVILKILTFNKKEFFINELIESLKLDKNNMRIEILTISTNYFSSMKNSSSKKIIKNFFDLLIEPLVLCIEDKFNKIRNLSEELIKESSNYISIDRYYEASKNLYSKVVQDKVNSKIREIYGLEDKNELKKSNVSISSLISNNNDLNKSKNKKQRSKSYDINNNQNTKINNNINNKKYIKKNVGKINKNIEDNNNNKKINQKNNKFNENKNEIDYKNVFKINQNFSELKKYRNNKDIKLGKNFLTIKEKSNMLLNNQNKVYNSNNATDLKPLLQIFTDDFINKCLIPCNKNLTLIIIQLNKVLLSTTEKTFKSDFLPNLDIILEFIIRLFDMNLINKNFDFIKEYINFIIILYEKISTQNTKLSQIEYNIILHSLMFLSKYDKKGIFNCIKNFYKLNSIERILRILFDYNDLNDIDTQKNSIELFLIEFNEGNIHIDNNNILFAKKVLKFFYDDDLIETGKKFFKDIYEKIGNKNFEEILSKLNKQEKNILLKNIDFFPSGNKNKIEEIEEKNTKINMANFKINLTTKNDFENINDKVNNPTIKNKNKLKLINKDNNTIIENQKIKEEQKQIKSIKEINELLIELNTSNDDFDIELYNKENDKNNNNILLTKFKFIAKLKNLFEDSNYLKNKKIIIESIELILDSLSKEINFFFNINTMIEDCINDIMKYTQEIISIFFIISSKQEIISTLNENILNKLIILFLNYLEIDKEEGIANINNIFNDMLQKINKITLNICHKGKRETIIIILIKLISNFKDESDISLLAINILVKLIKVTNFKKINTNDLLIEIIIAVEDENLFNEENNSKINELFLKTLKKLLNQLVIEKKYNILKDYQKAINKCNIQDSKVSVWIQKIIEHNKF